VASRSLGRQSFVLVFQELIPEVLSAKLSHTVADMHAKEALQNVTDFINLTDFSSSIVGPKTTRSPRQ
jgi:hypothetical protein